MAAVQYIHDPSYRALILRRSYADLSLPGAIMNRAIEWWGQTQKWSSTDKTMRFRNGGTLTFGYLQEENDKYRYQGAEFQFIGFDELTQFSETQYQYLFSRLRKTGSSTVPVRMRAASNPGGVGHHWVRNRFISREAVTDLVSGEYRDTYEINGRMFIPSMLNDNPAMDRDGYRRSLSRLDPVTRRQLEMGDWDATAEGRIKPGWLRYWRSVGDGYQLLQQDLGPGPVAHDSECVRFLTIDCAGSSDDMARESRGRPSSLSVISTWDFHAGTGSLIWRDCRSGKWEFPELLQQIRDNHSHHKSQIICVEDEKTGRAALQMLRNLPTKALSHGGKDKLTRAATALNQLEQGRIYLPQSADWVEDVRAKLLTWTGHPDEPADEIDTLSYAAIETYIGTGATDIPEFESVYA